MLTALSLYTGIGGLDFGFEAAGFRTMTAVEVDSVCCESIRLNRDWEVLEGEVNSFSSDDILDSAGLCDGEADVLIGGPPCQPFSKSSFWVKGTSRRLDDPRSDTLTAFLRVLRDTQPRVFLLENVKGFGFGGKDSGLQYMLDGVSHINRVNHTRYRVSWRVINAADYGVPQYRERMFLVASRDGRRFTFPRPTHGPAGQEPYRTAWDAIGDLPADLNEPDLLLKGKWAKLLPSIPEGENYLWHTPRGGGKPLFGWRTRYWNFMLKLAKARPSWTLQASPGPSTGPFHWRNRLLSAEELARLQAFPDGLFHTTTHRNIQRMIGNAVPPLLGEVLARSIRDQLLDNPSDPLPVSLLRKPLSSTPGPEPVHPVHRDFLPLIGNHRAHPGEGMGPRAVQRQV